MLNSISSVAVDTVTGDRENLGVKRPTISDIAKLAGVSKATVSRVINHPNSVAANTRETVLSAMEGENYRVSWQARALSNGRSDLIAIIITEEFSQVSSDPTFTRLLEAIHEKLLPTQYLPVIIFAYGSKQQEKTKHVLNRSVFDGAIHLSPYADFGLLSVLAREDIPTVLCSRLPNNPWVDKFSTVFADDVNGGRLAAEYLERCGASDPIVITGPFDNPAAVERVIGYRKVFTNLDDERVKYADWDAVSGTNALAEFFNNKTHFDSVLCGSDRIAIGVTQSLFARQISVPDEVKVIGFDNNPESLLAIPPLTTIAQPIEEEGSKSVDLLLELMSGGCSTTVELSMELVKRASA